MLAPIRKIRDCRLGLEVPMETMSLAGAVSQTAVAVVAVSATVAVAAVLVIAVAVGAIEGDFPTAGGAVTEGLVETAAVEETAVAVAEGLTAEMIVAVVEDSIETIEAAGDSGAVATIPGIFFIKL